jgi:hypothetical protein
VAFEILNFALVLYGGVARGESSQILAAASLGVFLSGVEPILTRFKFPDHAYSIP